MTQIPAPLIEEDLIAYFEGALTSEEHDRITARLDADPQAQALLADWTAQNDVLQQLYPAPDPALPDRLTRALHQAAPPTAPSWQGWRIAVMVGMLAIGTASGWIAHGVARPGQAQVVLAQAAMSAHDTFVVEVVHPVEVAATQRDHMDSWMSKRMGTDMRPPDLDAAGFRLMGGRILPSDSGPAGLYMYENGEGQRITLYVSNQPGQSDSAFRFATQGDTQSLYWNDADLGYAVVGDMPRPALRALADRVYDQLI